MKLQKLAGATSEIWQVFIRDSSSTTGAGLTGLVFNTASLTAYYHRDTDTTATAIALVTMTSGTFTSSGFKEIDATNMPGWYQFCPPNAALASGAKSCGFHLKGATNMAPLPIEVQLLAVNVDDAVRMGMTALPNAAAEAAGGLYTRGTGAGQINQDANGRIDANGKAWAGGSIPAPNVTGVPLVDDKYLLGTIYSTPATAGIQDVNTKNLGGTAQTGRDIGASVLLSTGTGAGQLDFTAGVVKANLAQILGTALTETAGQIAAAFKKLFDVATPVLTAASVNQTGDAYARLGAPAGASHAADVAAVKTDTAAVKTKTDSLTFTISGVVDSNVVDWKGTAAPANTGDAYARLGAPSGVSVSADVAAIKVDTAAIKVQTDKVTFTIANQVDVNVLDWKSVAAPAMTGDAFARIGAAGAGLTALGDTRVAHLDADVSSRMATYTQPTGFLAATFPGTVASPTNITAGTIGSVAGNVGGNVTGSVGSVAVGGISAASFAANALDAVWSTATRLLTAGTNIVLAKGTGVTGFNDLDASGVRGAVGLAAANLDTQLGAIDSDVLTRLASSSYTAPPSAATIAQAVWDVLTSALTTVGSIGKLMVTNIDAAISTRSTYAGGDTAGTTTLLSRLTSTRAGLLDHLDADISSRMATFSYTAPDNAGVTAIKAKTDNLPGDPADASDIAAAFSSLSSGISTSFTALQIHGDGAWSTATGFATSAALTTVSGNVDGIKVVTDSLVMTGGKLWVLDDQGNPLPKAGDITAAVPTASDNADAVLAATYEGAETVQAHLRLTRAALVGKATGLATTTAHYRDAADTKNRISATVDGDGNRSAVTTDAT